MVGTLYTEQHPEKVNALILAGALFSQQDTYDHILKSTQLLYQKNNDTLMLSRLKQIQRLDKKSAEYRKQCYEIASQNNYFNMPFPTTESINLREIYSQSEFSKNNIRNNNVPIKFYKNESRNTIDTKYILNTLKETKQVRLYAIYGKQDQIFSEKQIEEMKQIVKNKNFKLIDNCSHTIFIIKCYKLYS